MKIGSDQCGSVIYNNDTGNVVAMAPDNRRAGVWYPGKKIPADAKRIVEAGDKWRAVAKSLGWLVKA